MTVSWHVKNVSHQEAEALMTTGTKTVAMAALIAAALMATACSGTNTRSDATLESDRVTAAADVATESPADRATEGHAP